MICDSTITKNVMLCAIMSSLLMPYDGHAMNFDSKYAWLLGGFFGGALTCYVVQALYAQKAKKRIKPFKGFYIDYNFNFDLGESKEQKITLIFDSTNNRAFIASGSNDMFFMNSEEPCKKQLSGEYNIGSFSHGHDEKFFTGNILFNPIRCSATASLEITYKNNKKKEPRVLNLSVNSRSTDL